jgi:hypothetical protein
MAIIAAICGIAGGALSGVGFYQTYDRMRIGAGLPAGTAVAGYIFTGLCFIFIALALYFSFRRRT